ncbi:Predicted DNA-binding transcriptional regulator YafY, contains an HTH and WYL domains [Nitratiruptor tergarcus DSM 16512]|uniref:Predicted DNA-binding transcriptional regulator YafY, contains an HTH and WYL domains n=1 Tax=Nitratiruptor tergarcus DSM 16512 TaxID=1069081 RepID=A0A1W1WSC4_9BACT|nr:Predicted DNA-binding transcriptional regulator YafY, contains an HTH and WYL domains [Nitratiruptor tergarcus DSM 16512]
MTKSRKLLAFLMYIQKHRKFCIKHLAELLQTSVRNVQRLKAEIEEFFQISFIPTTKGCYALPQTLAIGDLLPSKRDFGEYEKFIDVLILTNSPFLQYLGFCPNNIIKKDDKIFFIKEPPFEELIATKHLQILKSAIYFKKYIDIVYKSDKTYYFSKVKPLKIVFAENNWYLAILSKDPINNGFKFLRINFIQEITQHPNTFKTPAEVDYFFKNFQSLFTSYNEPFFPVTVKVDAEVARHFKVKKFLKSQKILKEHEDGSLLIEYNINNDNEILLLAKRWLPHMRIISPAYLQKELENLLLKFLNDNN